MVANAEYNQIAVKTAEKVHKARQLQKQNLQKQTRTIEQKFPKNYRPGFGVAMEYERMGSQHISEELADLSLSLNLRLEHLGITLGTLIHGLDLAKPLDDNMVRCLRKILLERKVIFFRNQVIDPEELVRFASYFGELDAFPFGKGNDKNPFVLEIIHGEESPGNQNGWHTDVTWMENPSLGSVAQCIKLPPYGGDTLFSDSHACYLGMPTRLRDKVRYIWGENDYRSFLGEHSSGGLSEELVNEIKSVIPFGVNHPLFRTHPETKKTALYINPSFIRPESLYDIRNDNKLGESVSKTIISELLKQHNQPEYTCRFKWEKGSIAFWDNRAVQHFATSDYYPHQRVLRRVTISGDRPYFDSESDDTYLFG